MKLHGHFISLTTLQVMSIFAEKNSASPEFVPVDVFAGEQKETKHRKLHPFGHIPVLEDGDFQLYETHAILRYLNVRLAGPSFDITDAKERARMDQWLCIEQNYLVPAAKKIMARGYAEMMKLPDPGPGVVDEGRRELNLALEQFAAAIDGRRYVAGDAFSLADICWRVDLLKMATGPEAHWLDDRRISPWWKRVCDRPAWERAQADLAAYAPKQGPSAG